MQEQNYQIFLENVETGITSGISGKMFLFAQNTSSSKIILPIEVISIV